MNESQPCHHEPVERHCWKCGLPMPDERSWKMICVEWAKFVQAMIYRNFELLMTIDRLKRCLIRNVRRRDYHKKLWMNEEEK